LEKLIVVSAINESDDIAQIFVDKLIETKKEFTTNSKFQKK